MEKRCFVENGGMKMPIGYRFHPTDEEVVIHYLKPKVLAIPFPASVIPEFDVFQTDPWGLPGDANEKRRYFFSNHSKMNMLRRATGCGYWKPIGKQKLIVASQSNLPVGIRKTLVFCQNKHLNYATETRWFMHQFNLLGSAKTIAPGSSTQMPQLELVLLQDWAVHRVLQKKKRKRKQKKPLIVTTKPKNMARELNFMAQPYSSCSSGVTDQEDSYNELAMLGDEEASSASASASSSAHYIDN